MYSEDISDLRRNVRTLVDAAVFLNNLIANAPASAQPAIIAVYNALLEVTHTLNKELADEEDEMEDINLSYIEENGVSATIAFQHS